MTTSLQCFQFATMMGSPADIAIIAGVVVLLFGGAKVAEFGKSLGQGMREFKKGLQDDTPEHGSPSGQTPPADPKA